ncbi:MAG: prepilin peptidase [Gammaproteobacteria bacterium]|nr:prepilin peptidase [Gammaproteobacteria bacterium]
MDSLVILGGSFLFGLIIGSFLTVVVHRVPIMMEQALRLEFQQEGDPSDAKSPYNLAVPGSRCSACARPIKPWHNLPVLSYLMLRGRSACCDVPIPLRYPLLEILSGLMTVVVVFHFGVTVTSAAALILTYSLLALAAIDLEQQILPDSITLPVLWLGLLFSVMGGLVDCESSILGAAIGYLSLWSVYQLFKCLTGKEGMGYGDFKLLALLGAWLGWQAVPLVIVLSSVVGALFGLGLVLFRHHASDQPIPFGPFLAAAGWIVLLFGEDLTRLYWGLTT